MCVGGGACSRGKPGQARCASSLEGVSGIMEVRRENMEVRTDQVWDEEEDVLPWIVFGRVGGLHSSAVAVAVDAVPYCSHCDGGSVCVC
jgi:hypothetical protein